MESYVNVCGGLDSIRTEMVFLIHTPTNGLVSSSSPHPTVNRIKRVNNGYSNFLILIYSLLFYQTYELSLSLTANE